MVFGLSIIRSTKVTRRIKLLAKIKNQSMIRAANPVPQGRISPKASPKA